MTAFDLFQTATVLIMRSLRTEAAELITKAIALIDRDGVDADLRADLVALRDRLTIEVAA